MIDPKKLQAGTLPIIGPFPETPQPTRPEVPSSGLFIAHGVILALPVDQELPMVSVGIIRPSSTFETDGGTMEFVRDAAGDVALRPVLCEPFTLAKHYAQWLWSGPTDVASEAMVACPIYRADGALWIMHKGRHLYIEDTGGFESSDCQVLGGT